MQYAVSLLPVVPLRSAPSDKEEMTSQVIFGEQLTIIEKHQKWSFVEVCHDGYSGWLNNSMINPVSGETISELNSSDAKIVGNLFLPVINNQNKYPFYIPATSTLYHYKPASNTFHINDIQFICQQEPFFYKQDSIREDISQAALKFINVPYLWGGKNPFGLDCSGLTQTVMKLFGRSIPRDARQQVREGKTINFISEAQPGDLAFFDNEEGDIIHTGIIIDGQMIIHAYGQVRLDRVDHQGIYNSRLKQYTHKLRVIKDILN